MASSQALAVRNALLASLPLQALTSLLPKLSPVEVTAPRMIYSPDTAIDAAYFPVSGMISLVVNLRDGVRSEVGIIGREGMLGMSLFAGSKKSFVEAIVQMPGTILRMAAEEFRSEIDATTSFRSLMFRYSEVKQDQIMQTAACNASHGIDQRLARWLLMAHDRADGDEVPLTHGSIAMMLSVSRTGISRATADLQRTKLIRYTSSHITVLNRTGLEEASCGCYAAVQKRFSTLFGNPEDPLHNAY